MRTRLIGFRLCAEMNLKWTLDRTPKRQYPVIKSVELSAGVAQGLAERVYVVQDDGTVRQRDQYLPLRRKIRAVYRAAGDAFGHRVKVRYDDQGWQQFQIATAVRDRITHPKSFLECDIGVEELDTVDRAEEWFRDVYNEFV